MAMEIKSFKIFFSFLVFFGISCITGFALPVSEKFSSSKPVYLSLTLEEAFSDSLPLEQLYLDQLNIANDSSFKADFESEFLLVLNKKQREYYLSLPTLLDKKEFIKQYWRAYNPDPILPQNDRLIDHIRRSAFARANFPSDVPPYIDDRGKYYIKYGKPTIRYVDPGGIRRISLFSPGIYEQIEQFYTMGTAPSQNYSVPANESWGYENVSPNFVVHFVWKGQTFKEIKSLSEILRSRKRSNMAWQWSDLIKKRASISPVLSETAASIESFEVELMHVAFSGNSGFKGDKFSTGSAHDKMIQRLETGEKEILKAAKKAPPASYDPIKAVQALQFFENISQFRGPGGKTRVDISLLSPIEKNFLAKLDTSISDTLSIEFSGMLRDRVFRLLDQNSQISTWPAALAARENLQHAAGYLSLLAKPQRTELTLQVRDKKKDRIGYTKEILNIRNFNRQNLLLSDVQFFRQIKNEKQKLILPTTEIDHVELTPYPSVQILKSEPLYCYFEIYNLQSSGIKNSYEIAYKISSQKGSQSIFHKISRLLYSPADVSISLKQSQPLIQDTSHELIALDLASLPGGEYLLEITVADAQNDRLFTRTTRKLFIID